MRHLLNILFLMTLAVMSSGQDAHFSQFDRNPLHLSPALAGQMDGYGRFAAQYNSQWSVIGVKYNTGSFSFDMPLFKSENGAYLGAGINVIRDKAGDSEYGFTNAGLVVNGILPVGDGSELSLGIQTSFVQRSISRDNLQWDNQFDGTGYNSSIGGEGIGTTSFHYFDFATGMNYHYNSSSSTMSSNDGIVLDIGGSYGHFTQPELQFKGSGDRLPARINVYGIGKLGLSGTKFYVSPMVKYSSMGKQKEIVGGGYFGYTIAENSKATGFVRKTSIAFGAVYRFKDAIVPGMIYEIGDFSLQVSYDVNLSTLSTYTSGRGGLEISLMYVDHLGTLFGGGTSHKALFN